MRSLTIYFRTLFPANEYFIRIAVALSLICPSLAMCQTPPAVWGTPANLFGALVEYGIQVTGPAIDGQGNAYVVLASQASEESPMVFSMVKSNGTTGSWNPPQPFYSIASTQPGQCFPIVADTVGNATVFCSLYLPSGTTDVIAFRYNGASGWLAPVTLYEGPQPYNVLAVTDANNDVVLVLSAGLSKNTRATCYIYSAAAQTWLPPVGIAPTTNTAAALDQTLSVNRAGTAIFFVYLDQLGYTTSLYGQRFDVPTLTWEPAQLIPGSAGKNNQIPPQGNALFPLAVDGSGAASVFFSLSDGTAHVSRNENGSWGQAIELVRAKDVNFQFTSYASADANGNETAMVALGFTGNTITQYFFAYNGSTWSTSTVEQYPVTSSGPFIAFSFTGIGNTGLINYYSDPNKGAFSVLNNGSGWSAPTQMPFGVPGVLATDKSGHTVLVTTQEVTYNTYNVYGSWLQN